MIFSVLRDAKSIECVGTFEQVQTYLEARKNNHVPATYFRVESWFDGIPKSKAEVVWRLKRRPDFEELWQNLFSQFEKMRSS